MRFRRGAKLDPGQVTDVRGRRMAPGGLAVGGGGIGIVAVVIYLLLTVLGGGGGLDGQLTPLDEQQVGQGDTPGFWNGTFDRSNRRYPYANTVFYTGQVQTQCGFASSQVGPFYCPRDQKVYIDLGFFDELQSRFGAGGGPFAQAYVIAHEYGNHVQNQLGVLEQIGNDRQGPQSRAVRSELQADCYAGVWAANAVKQGLLEELTQQDINEGLDAASAIGDDRIQEQTQGQVNPEGWTHGSSEQRRRWFSRGYEEGRPAVCDTFSGSI